MAKIKIIPISTEWAELVKLRKSEEYNFARIKNTDAIILFSHGDMFIYSKKVHFSGSEVGEYKLRKHLITNGYTGHYGLYSKTDWMNCTTRLQNTVFTKDDYENTKNIINSYVKTLHRGRPEYGVELEVESDCSLPGSEIAALGGALIQDVGCDGSVHGGTEIRFNHPTMKGWRYKDVANLLKFCSEKGATNKYGTAGMHVHISHKNIEKIVDRFTQNLSTMQEILYPINCRKKIKANGERVHYGVESNIYHNQIDSFGTLEIRAWNSTLDPKLFLARIKFCKTITEWLAKAKEITVDSFFNYMTPAEKRNYGYMLNHPENPHEWGFPPKAVNALLAA